MKSGGLSVKLNQIEAEISEKCHKTEAQEDRRKTLKYIILSKHIKCVLEDLSVLQT